MRGFLLRREPLLARASISVTVNNQVDFEGEPGGFFKLAEPIVVRIAQRQFQDDLETLKDLLESG